VLAVQSELSAAGRIAARLGGGSTLTAIGMFFVFGLFLALTPCVFPMVPILSGIIVGQQQPVTVSRGLSLSAVYVLGMAATYACVGLVAGLFGHNLQAAFQHPAVLLAFSAVFALLALSMFGFYDLRIPAGIQSRLDRLSQSKGGGTLIGVAIMGVLSAIIVGPCVAPPLAGALLYLGHQGDPLVGGTALFVLGLGMGAPLLLIGASAGKLLPRAGEWMVVVQRVFGVILLGVAVWFLERVIGSSWAMLLWGGLAVGAAIYMGALDSLDGVTSGWPRLWKGVGIVMLCYGLTMIVGASAGGEDPLRPLAAFAQRGADSPELEFLPIKGLGGFDEQITAARAAGKPVLLDFYADWCIECKHLERETFADEQIKLRLADVVLLRADVTANDADDQALLKNFELFGPPAVLFFDTQGTERRAQRLLGFMGPSDFGSLIEQVYDR
jgi:thiol:disulfide interchange protein DsbD